MFRKLFGLVCAILFAAATPAFLQAQHTILHRFAGPPNDGAVPEGGGFVRKGNTLFGLTGQGGPAGYGTIFKINTDGTGYATFYSFTGTDDGAFPCSSLTILKNKLAGMAIRGGTHDRGTVFSVNLDGTGLTKLHDFSGGAADGAWPYGALVRKGSNFYGLTSRGGAYDGGTIFKIKTDGKGFVVLHSFAGGPTDGRFPLGSLISSGGKLYGMTSQGGPTDEGTIFQINMNGSGFKILHFFTGGAADGANPFYGAVTAKGSALYGMTIFGGEGGCGTIFKINKNGKGFGLLHSFRAVVAEGWFPYGSLIFDRQVLYGMTSEGGSNTLGTIFRINRDGTGFGLIHSFPFFSTEGFVPRGDLLRVASKKTGTVLFGMTIDNFETYYGTVFSHKIN